MRKLVLLLTIIAVSSCEETACRKCAGDFVTDKTVTDSIVTKDSTYYFTYVTDSIRPCHRTVCTSTYCWEHED